QPTLGPLLLLTDSVPLAANALPLPENPATASQEDQHQRGQQTGDPRVATAPADDSLASPNGTRSHRFAGLETPKIVRQSLGGGITATGFLPQAFQANGFEIARHCRL